MIYPSIRNPYKIEFRSIGRNPTKNKKSFDNYDSAYFILLELILPSDTLI